MGFTVYRPDDDSKRHPVDSLVISGQSLRIVMADVKTKPRRTKYPDTGINMINYGEYQRLQKINKIPVYIIFVDEFSGTIYGNFLDELDERKVIIHEGKKLVYPLYERSIIYFPLISMKQIGRISPEESAKLKALSRSKFIHRKNDVQISLDLKPNLISIP